MPCVQRGIRILADALVVIGLLTKQHDTYALTDSSALFLNKKSPAYLGHATRFLLSPMLSDAHDDVAGAVRRGGTILPDQGSVTPENDVWVDFARGMAPMMMPAAQAIAAITGAAKGEKWKVLDIAAGHGLFGITLAQKNPNAEIVALDWDKVLTVAEENARAFGVAGRLKKLPGSAMEVEFGNDYDIVLVTNFLHHFNVETNEKLLKKVYRALKPGGRAVTLEFVPNDDRVSPPQAAFFSVTMLTSTPHGDAYTFKELEGMFKNAGFARSELHPMEGGMPESIIVSYKG